MNVFSRLSVWVVVFAAACLCALLAVFRSHEKQAVGDALPAAKPLAYAVLWRTPMAARPNAPAPAPGRQWVVTDASGAVCALSETGKTIWRSVFSNQTFEASACVSGTTAVVATEQGLVAGLHSETGTLLWSVRMEDARFQCCPVMNADGASVVVVSQTDGRLFCIRLSDGAVLWRGGETNRCDGGPVAWDGRIAYGNCDGAVYVFDARDGRLLRRVAVGEDDQMAGRACVLDDRRVAVGTRQGNLAVANVEDGVCEGRVRISESEAFLTPVRVADGRVAMGNGEGEVSFWRVDGKALVEAGRLTLGAPVDALEVCPCGERLFALVGGSLAVWNLSDPRRVIRVALGDDVYGLTVRTAGEAACVADGAVVCMREVE